MKPRQFRINMFATVKIRHCWMCGCELTFDTSTVDHLLPKKYDGRNSRENYRLACKPCNNARGDRFLTKQEWIALLGKSKARIAYAKQRYIEHKARLSNESA